MLPLEILHQIAKQDIQAYRALLAIPEFARSQDLKLDFMVHFGHTVLIEGNTIKWFLENKPHGIDGPAIQMWDNNGQLICEWWFKFGKYHRDDGPAFQEWNADGQIICEQWYRDGIFHRDGAPAYQRWNNAGQLTDQFYSQHSRVS